MVKYADTMDISAFVEIACFKKSPTLPCEWLSRMTELLIGYSLPRTYRSSNPSGFHAVANRETADGCPAWTLNISR
jgi:hypothetical protein